MSYNRRCYIKEERIGICEFLYEDHFLNYENWFDKEMQKNYNHKPHWKSFDEYLKVFNNPKALPRFQGTIIKLDDNIPIGKINLSPKHRDPDIAICIFSNYRKRGYGLEALTLGIEYIFENIDLDYIYAGVYEHNIASIKIIRKLGFERVDLKTEKEVDCFSGEEISQLLFRLDKMDFLNENLII